MQNAGNIQERQNSFLSALVDNKGSITAACEAVGVERSIFLTWLLNQDFEQRYQDAHEAVIDGFEQHLARASEKGDTAATIFALATLGKDRGYSLDGSGLSALFHAPLDEQRFCRIMDKALSILNAHNDLFMAVRTRTDGLEQRLEALENRS